VSETILPVQEWELSEAFIRSSGPGGQNVNKVSSGVQLRFDVRSSPSLEDRVKLNLEKVASHLMSRDGVLMIEATRYRTQVQNRADARRRLTELIKKASKPPPPKRRPTRPGRGAVERRLKRKTERAFTKKMRSKRISDD